MPEQPQLVGARRVARGAVGRQVGLERLDMVLRLARLAIDLFIDGARRTGIEVGGDEARVYTVESGFDAGDDAFDAIPARGTIIEFLEPPEVVATTRGGEARGRALGSVQRVGG